MPIRPIDLQTIAALTKEVERVQATLQQRPTDQQMQFAAQFRHDKDAAQSQVSASPKSESAEVTRDKQGSGEREAGGRHRRSAKREENVEYIDDDEGHRIDIRA